MPVNAVSAPKPWRSTTRLLTVTGPSLPAVKCTFVNGTRDAPPGASEFAGWSAALVMVSPVPASTTTTGVVPGATGVAAAAPPQRAFNFTREAAPKYPVPAERPTGARTSEAYLFWNFTTAAFVAGPKVDVSFPAEPAPLEATMVSADELRNFCNFITSSPLAPTVRFRAPV